MLHRPSDTLNRVFLWMAWFFVAMPLSAAQPLALKPLHPKVYWVEGETALGSRENRNFVSNGGVIITSAGVVVIDGLGSPALARELLRQIQTITPLPVTHVIVTHYHADHVYGLQVLAGAGARIWAHRSALDYLHSETAQQRLSASRQELHPWIDEQTRLVHADHWIDKTTELKVGDTTLQLRPLGPAHTAEDLVVHLPELGILFAGDLVFRGRIPFVGQSDSRNWIEALSALLAFQAQILVPGHGPVSKEPQRDLELTRRYLQHLRQHMGKAARDMEPFDEAYARVDWSEFAHLPLFRLANRMNAYNTYLLLEREEP